MKLKQAREIGHECGLETDAECVNNILIHGGNLFVYADIPKEEGELITDAKAHGIRFSEVCGDAIEPGASEDAACSICQKLAALP